MEIKFYNVEERDTVFSIIKSFIENDKVKVKWQIGGEV